MRAGLLWACAVLWLPSLGCDTPDEPDPAPTTQTLDCPAPAELPFTTLTDRWIAPEVQAEFDGTVPGYGGLDVLGPPGDEVVFEGVMARNDRVIPTPLRGEWVSAWQFTAEPGWEELGRELTDFGRARYSISVSGDALAAGQSRIYAVLEGAGHCADHGVFPWPPGTPVIVSDIDGTLTLSDEELTTELSDPSYVQRAWPGAVDLTTTWAGKGFGVVYLTARTDELRSMTRPWLDDLGFAFGPLSTSPELVLGGSAADYKAGFLSRLLDELDWDVVAVYGNADSDIEAYSRVGIPLDRTFIIGANAGAEGTVAVEGGWEDHIEAFVRPFPDAN